MFRNTVLSWKTSILGVLAFLIALMVAVQAMMDADPSTVANWDSVVETFIIMIALFTARDGDKSSEDMKVK